MFANFLFLVSTLNFVQAYPSDVLYDAVRPPTFEEIDPIEIDEECDEDGTADYLKYLKEKLE